MSTDRYVSPLSERYASKEMQYIFSPDKKFRTWRKLWIALAETEKELGLPITQEQIDELKAHQDDINYDVAKAREKEVRHDVMSHVYAYGCQCPKAKGIIHLGATSCYVGDNTDIIVMTEALKLVHKKLVNVLNELAAFADKYKDLEVFWGAEGLKTIASMESCDMVLNSLMGMKGLEPTMAAIESGKDIAFANKETLVAGGQLVMDAVKKHGVAMLPVDSEHSAIFQSLQGNQDNEIRRILLTASGGPFRGYSLEQLEQVSLEQALNHPNWSMGSKITIDSATMMNKGLEVIEARWLFDVPLEKIQVVVHPQSILHSAVEYMDSSVIGQMGNPDMRIPIAYAFSYPERMDLSDVTQPLDLFSLKEGMSFYPAEIGRAHV